jgi:tRNA modification GTPase
VNTIVACATGSDPSALAVVRLSGPEARSIASALCGGHRFDVPRQLDLVSFSDAKGPLDRCLAVVFLAPRSFTGEDLIEFHLHGGPGLVEAAVQACVVAGARRAEPGEFTRRAYLAGKLDLVEAEAIAARAGAATERAARLAEAGVAGRLSAFARRIEGELTNLRARVEGWLDFAPEELRSEDLIGLIEAIKSSAERLALAAQVGARSLPLFEAPIVLLSGPVNAGKSSLFNALVGSDRALVSSEAGTTRDWLEAELQLPAGRLRLRDSAGLRRAQGAVEAAGIERAQSLRAEADLVLWCCAPEQRIEVPDEALAVSTKADLSRGPGLAVSAYTGDGIDALLAAISERVFCAVAADSETGVATSRRQLERLDEAAERSREAADRLAQGAPELAAADLRQACEALAALTGTQEPDEIMLDALFGQFCLGK